MKKDKILQKYLVTLFVLLCLIGLSAGSVYALNNTGAMSRNVREQILTDEDIKAALVSRLP